MTTQMDLESQVRSYSRSWPTVFERAVGSAMYDRDGREFLDFFSGAGALNYGHNHPALKQVAIDYLTGDQVVHSLDMFTSVREQFLETFASMILAPRDRLPKIEPDMLPAEISSSRVGGEGGFSSLMGIPLREARENFEREYLNIQIRRFSGNISKTAAFIGMERSALHRKLKLLGMGERSDGK